MPWCWPRCTAGVKVACEVGYYNNQLNANNQAACVPCPTHSTTAAESSTLLEQCLCDAEYYNANTTGGVTCVLCPVGTLCFEAGVSLGSLPLGTGYYRPSRDSLDVRRCPDAFRGNKSGCLGGSGEPCRSTLAGPFCALCDRSNTSALVYYVQASDFQTAHCEECGNSTAQTVLLACGAVAFALLLVFLLRLYKPMGREGVKRFMHNFSPQNKIKILIAFYMIATKVDESPAPYHLVPLHPTPFHLTPPRTLSPHLIPCPPNPTPTPPHPIASHHPFAPPQPIPSQPTLPHLAPTSSPPTQDAFRAVASVLDQPHGAIPPASAPLQRHDKPVPTFEAHDYGVRAAGRGAGSICVERGQRPGGKVPERSQASLVQRSRS